MTSNKPTYNVPSSAGFFEATDVPFSLRNKKQSRIAIISINVPHERLFDHTATHYHKQRNIEKISKETLSEEFRQVAIENYEFQFRRKMKTNWTFLA